MPGPYRFGPAALFAATVGVLYLTVGRRYGRGAGLLGALGLLTMPRVFAHAHLASYDVPTLCLWFLAVAAFLAVVDPPEGTKGRAWPATIAFGAAWGCAMATKLTGWFLPVPLLVWTVLYRDARGARTLVLGGLVAALVLYAQIPTWWADPVAGLREFFASNLSRHNQMPIPILFLGRVYRFALPWYNTVVWTAITVPPLTLLLALVGAGRVVAGRLRDRAGTLLLGGWGFFLVLRALPNVPGHDGVRQFLAGFVFLACLAGVGLATAGAWLERAAGARRGRTLTAAVLAAAVGTSAWSTWRYHPVQLSYYNLAIGGLSGAARAGMEPTYYWDAVTPDVIDWLNTHTDDGRTVAFTFPTVSFQYLHHWGLLRPDPRARREPPPQWFVVMNRPGVLRWPTRTIGQLLIDRARPVYVKSLDVAPEVPLVAIYSGEDAYAAGLFLRRATPAPAAARDGRQTPVLNNELKER
jgi:hypothetical protein